MSVLKAVNRDLAAFKKVAPDVAESAEAATARALAREIDGDSSSTSKSMCARVLVDTMEQLRARLPEEQKATALDDLRARRAARLGRSAAQSS